MKDDFSLLTDSLHMFRWLHPEPLEEIRASLQQNFNQQLAGSTLQWFQVTTPPQWRTGGRKTEDEAKLVVTRAGVAFGCAMEVRGPDGTPYALNGVFTWVGRSLDDPEKRNTQIWMDLDATLEEMGEATLLTRLYNKEP